MDEEKRECDCCGYPATLKSYPGPIYNVAHEGVSQFCEVCAFTFLSHPITYPALSGYNRHLFSSIGWIANRVLDAIAACKTESERT